MLNKITQGFCITNNALEYTVHYIEKKEVYYCCANCADNDYFTLYRTSYENFKKMVLNALNKENVTRFTKLGFKPFKTLDLITLNVN